MTGVACTAEIDPTASVGEETKVWDLAQIREGAVVGRECTIGRGAYIGPGVRVGCRVKIQNNALVYEPARLADGVFIGPAAVLTNDLHPRAVNPDGTLKSSSDWTPVGVNMLEGASLGARAVCVAPLTIGRWAMVGAGATVLDDVPDFALVVGSPARRIGWVGRAGLRLLNGSGNRWHCPRTHEAYAEVDGKLTEVERGG